MWCDLMEIWMAPFQSLIDSNKGYGVNLDFSSESDL